MDFSEKLSKIKDKYDKITDQLSDPDNTKNHDKLISLSKERSDLTPLMTAYERYMKIINGLNGNKEIIDANEDAELVAMAELEMEELKAEREKLEAELKFLLLPKDPNDDKNVIFEIRAGTGGEEAALFAGDLFRMYTRYAEVRGWKYELIDLNDTGLGGLKEAVFSIQGIGVFGDLKFESGVHRVQRVPETEGSGRVHTSAASVAVLPEVEDVQVDINPGDLKIDVYRSGGAGGQNVNKVETAIRITHLPSGIVVQCQDERSQLKNRQKALKVLRARLYDSESKKQASEIAAQRRIMVGSGDRSDKIRTYNFPQNRVTDHRIGLTLYNLSGIINGDLNDLIEQMKIADRTERLEAD
ncbi:MAG: peptide chain release factor 1 [Ignavibacteriales bacterium]|nr:peptide chain release factor 1 [Ignavibacteriales bacterium]